MKSPLIAAPLAAACLMILGCGDPSGPQTPSNPLDIPDIGAGIDYDTASGEDVDDGLDAEAEVEDVAAADPEDAPLNIDVLLRDSFDRPSPDAEPDADRPDPPAPTIVSGTRDCLRYTLRADSTIFTLKEDVISVHYEVRNTCTVPLRMRSMHESDFFAVAILKDGQPWVFLAEPHSCPGLGPAAEYMLTPGGGWIRGWLWRPDEHETRLDRCGAVYERGSQYAIVGYGMSPVSPNDPNGYSEIFVMTEPIPITLLQ